MKILVNYLGKANAGPVIALAMARSLAEIGNEVYVLLSSNISNKSQWDDCKGIKKIVYIDTYTNKIGFVINTIKFFFARKKMLDDMFYGIQFDMVFNPMHHMWTSMICKKYKDVRIVSVCHDPIAHEGENLIETIMTHRQMKMSDDVIVLTKKFIPIIQEKYCKDRRHIFYMPHGVSDMYKRINVKQEVYDKDIWHFLFFGRIEEYKGVEVLVNAFAKLEKIHSDVDLYIVGKGNVKGIDKITSKNIHIINEYVEDSNVGNFFDNDKVIVVLPYVSASQSGVVAVALLYGNVIISSDVGGLKEQLDDGKAGLFTSAGSVDDLFKKMKMIIEDEALFMRQKTQVNILSQKLEWGSIMSQVMKDIAAVEM